MGNSYLYQGILFLFLQFDKKDVAKNILIVVKQYSHLRQECVVATSSTLSGIDYNCSSLLLAEVNWLN